jgi:hypothetical protein
LFPLIDIPEQLSLVQTPLWGAPAFDVGIVWVHDDNNYDNRWRSSFSLSIEALEAGQFNAG